MNVADVLRKNLAFMQGNIRVLTINQVLGMFARSMVFPYASLYILSLGGEPAQIGWVNSLAPLAGLIVFPLGGYIADHAGRVRIIALTGYLSGIIYLLFILAPNWQVIAVATVLQGATVLQFPPTSAILADSLTPNERGRGIATMYTMAGLLAIVSPYIAGAIISKCGVNLGMRFLYAWLMITNIGNAFIQQRFLRETTDIRTRIDLAGMREALAKAYAGIPQMLRQLPGSLRGLAVVTTLGFVSNAIAGPFWVVYAVEHIGLSAPEWGLILLVETILRNSCLIPAGFLVDRFGRRGPMLVALALSLVSVPFFVVASGFAEALAIRAVVGLANALFMPASSALMADSVPREIRGRVMSALGSGGVMLGAAAGGTGGPSLGFLLTLPLMLASFSAGYIYQWNPAAPWFFVLGATLLSLIVTLLFVKEPRVVQA